MTDDTSDGDDVPPRFDPTRAGDDRSVETLVSALANQRARHAVAALDSRSENVVELDDLVDSVVEREAAEQSGADDAAGDRSAADIEAHREQVAIALHHRSLPKLDDTEVLDYDPRSNTVRYRDDGRIAAYLEFFDREANV
ncbi:DUF7344 domain-containing protein [Halorussus lipolyticus]|uniref:DUF7344 domain-containing protein n=1 Tax=Halorussus lipolyticus TaxID=3034024 RepID=UPI0023E7CE27|nr:hypothetical protein [Halorussus sp. DT80]